MRRNTKTMYEWRKAYRDKEELMLERGFPEVSPHEFYRDLFPEGSLQSAEHDGKGNLIATQIRPSGKGRTKQWVVDDSLNMLDKVIGDEFGLIPPITFYGKTHTKQNAHELYAVAIDIDYVGKQQLKNLLKQFGNGVQLRPTYLVSSGKGVHAYYFLKEPVQLYHNLEDTLAELKEAFIRRLWNDTSSIRPDSPDITGIYQGFRCVGSQSKLGADFPVKAYKMSDNRYTLEDIKDSIPNCKVDLSVLTEKPKKEKGKLSLDEAKKLYPEWYQERVVEGRPKKKGTWVCNEALYEWWKNKIFTEVKVGGRYFSIMALCAYGLKCGISERRIRQDAYSFLEHLESLTDDEDNHFTREDVKDALKTEYKQQIEDGFNESVIDGYSGFIFKSRYNTVLSPHGVNRVLDRIIKAYNTQEEQAAKRERRKPELLPHFSCHNLRHTFCTRFCENETNLKVIQEIMGHADITTTMDIYNEATKEKKMESFAGLEGKIKIR